MVGNLDEDTLIGFTNIVGDFFDYNNSKIDPIVFTISFFFYKPATTVLERVITNDFYWHMFSFLIFSHFSNIDSFILNFSALQTSPNISDFKYQNSLNSSYLYSFLSFSNQIGPTIWAREVLNRLNAHPLSNKSCHYALCSGFSSFFLIPNSFLKALTH